MPTWRKAESLAINATNSNVLQGSIYEYMSRPTRVVIAAASDQTDVKLGVQFGSRTMALAADTEAPKEPAAGVGPNIPDQVVVDDLAMPGDRIVVSLQGGAAASVTRILAQFTEVA